jgi:hypothetical protein
MSAQERAVIAMWSLAMTDALVFDPAECRLGDEVRVGNWRGIIKQHAITAGEIQVWCARTWIE